MNSRDTLATELNVLEHFQPIVPETYQDASIVMLRKFTSICPIECFRSNDKNLELVILDTMNFWMDNALEPLIEVIKSVDVITINDEEARQLTGEYSLVKAAQENSRNGTQNM